MKNRSKEAERTPTIYRTSRAVRTIKSVTAFMLDLTYIIGAVLIALIGLLKEKRNGSQR